MEEKNVNQSNKGLLWVTIVLLCCAFGLGGWYLGTKSTNKETQPTTNEKNEKVDKVVDSIEDKRSAEDIIAPFLKIINYCDSKESFIYNEATKYEDFSSSTAIDIALNNLSYEERTKQQNEDDADGKYPDIEKSYIKEKIAYTFGKNKNIEFPKKLEFSSDNLDYNLNGDKYIFGGQGGGCLGYKDHFRTKYYDSKKESDKLIIQVNYIYITYDESHITAAEDPIIPVIFYNNISKERTISKLDKNGTEEDEAEKLLKGEKTDYLSFTFGIEDGHYIFEKVEIVKR